MPSITVREFVLPDLGEGLEDAVLQEWRIDVGDGVTLNQVLCTVETAKATVDVPSPFAGRVVERRGRPGETIPVGALLVRIETSGGGPTDTVAGDAAPAILVGYGPDEAPTRGRKRRRGRRGVAPAAAAASSAVRVLAKPPVRRLALDLGVDLTHIAPGSGPDGIITRADVEAAAPTLDGAASPSHAVSRVRPGDEVPMEGARARIAERMTISRATIPDAGCRVEADCTRLLEVRAELRETEGADALTPFALILRGTVLALARQPILNSVLDSDAGVIRIHEHVHLGVGTDTDRGLMVPVVREADRRSALDLAVEVRRLAKAARSGSITPAELTGSTFTVSNFGRLGIDDGLPVINHPEVAILGVGTIRPRAVVVEGEVVPRPIVYLTCSFDHRVCDGSDVGAFLTELRDLVESPSRLLID